MIRSLCAALVVGALTAAPSSAQDRAITVFVVRHAEKGPEQPDPSLTAAGAARAAALATMLADARVTAVYATQFKLTQETAAPSSQAAKVPTTVIDAGKTDALVAALKALPAGSRALVVSHSNVVPAIVEKLSGERVGELTDADYDRLYVVTIRPDGASVLLLRYGTPSPTGTAPMRP